MASARVSGGPLASGAAAYVRDASALGKFIRNWRKSQRITLTQAAGLAGVGVRFLHELERGKTTASLGKTLQVIDRMGLVVRVEPRQPSAGGTD